MPGSEGGKGIADVLFGDYSPTGKLSHTWPESYFDVPVNSGKINGQNILFPYGFGLTYENVNSEEEFISETSMKIYPNPANEYISLNINGFKPFSLSLMDMKGKVIISKSHYSSNYINIPVSEVEPGIYLISVKGDNKSIVKKVIIR